MAAAKAIRTNPNPEAKTRQYASLLLIAPLPSAFCYMYLRQVEMEPIRLSFGLTLLENLMRTVEGITATYQVQTDRALNRTIAAADVGLATSAIAASALITQSPEARDIASIQATAFGISIIVGALTSVIVWKLLRR